jgi:outer membrane protein assembly factor BamB
MGLLLETADGLADTALELFRLPSGQQTSAVPMDHARVPGWTWFPPAHDAEKLAAVGDRGILGLFGMRQSGASDAPLYAAGDREPVTMPTDGPPQRALVLMTEDDSLIALVGGRMKQWRLVIDRINGRKLVPGWSMSEPIGAPIQSPIIEAGIAYLTTQRNNPPATLVTAVRLDSGEVIWQRTFGFDPTAPYVRQGDAVIALDHRGALLALSADDATPGWSFAGKELAGPLPGLIARPNLVRGPIDDWIAVLPTLKNVALRRITPSLVITEQRIELPASLAGQPGFSPKAAVLPLANGVLVRVGDDNKPIAGPTWRTTGVGPDAVGSVTHWHDDSFLVTDGGRRLVHLNWPSGNDYKLETASALERPRALLGPPVVIGGTAPRAAIADAAGNVLLIRGDKLEVERTWRLGGDGKTITGGPVLVAGLLLVIIDGKHVIALQPDRDNPTWHFEVPGGTTIGQPSEFAGKIALADSQGRVWLIDASTGKATLANGFTLPGSSVAAAAPVALGADRLFVPLADGTAIVLTTRQLTQAATD